MTEEELPEDGVEELPACLSIYPFVFGEQVLPAGLPVKVEDCRNVITRCYKIFMQDF